MSHPSWLKFWPSGPRGHFNIANMRRVAIGSLDGPETDGTPTHRPSILVEIKSSGSKHRKYFWRTRQNWFGSDPFLCVVFFRSWSNCKGQRCGLGRGRIEMPVTAEALHEELDDIAIDYLETVDNYVRTALDEERLIKEGLINIAHARMIIKPQEITLEGFPNDLTKDLEAPTRVGDEEGEDVGHRKLEMNSSKDLECRRIFGQVIPASLKTAQGSFHRVLERTVERANILSRLNYLSGRQCELQKQLKDLDADKENSSVN